MLKIDRKDYKCLFLGFENDYKCLLFEFFVLKTMICRCALHVYRVGFIEFIGTIYPIWIGLFYNFEFANFTWTDNTPYDYSIWASGQPNTTSTQNCVLNGGFTSGFTSDYFTWYTDICDDAWYFVCKKSPNL